MDYDRTTIPDTYDAGRELSESGKRSALVFFAENLIADEISTIVDLGCGTARFSRALADLFDADVLGVDPSRNMLDQARKKVNSDRLTFALGSGEAIPAADGSIDLVFMSMVLHHLKDPVRAAEECRRVLRVGGSICIRNTVSDEISSYPYLEFFPSIRKIIAGELVSRSYLSDVFAGAGCSLAVQRSAWDEVAPNWPAYAAKVALKADSFIARLPDQEFKHGLEALRSHAERADPSQPVGLNVDQFVFRKTMR
ncbi:MAG: class I SAM-dependent methyltransferase [Hyphomicrobiaceae bacterium]